MEINFEQSLYATRMDATKFQFEMLTAPPLLTFLTVQDIAELNRIITSIKYTGRPQEKQQAMKDVLGIRGWIRCGCGTNRMVFRHRDFPQLLLKVALDKIGLGDSLAEFKNQRFLQPFVAKVYEVSPCGTVALVEKVIPITSKEDFLSIGNEVFDLMTKVILGKYVIEDIGTHYFMNYGVRLGFGPVLLDYPYVYRLDVNKLFCNAELGDHSRCNGIIDYDAGLNRLQCNRCGKKYMARDLANQIKGNCIRIEDVESHSNLKVSLVRNGQKYKRIHEDECIE